MTLAELSYRMACEPDLLKALLAEPMNALVSAKIHLDRTEFAALMQMVSESGRMRTNLLDKEFGINGEPWAIG